MRVGGRVLVRSAGVRFGLIYAGLFGISALALAMFLWWSTAGLLSRETDAAINADTQGLHERYTESGLIALGKTIEQRIDQNIDDDAIYLLVTPQLQPIAGNLDHWPERVPLDASWAMLPIDRAGIAAWPASTSSCWRTASGCWSAATCRWPSRWPAC